MSFATDNNWPAGLRDIFHVCRYENQPSESRYYGPYIKLLDYIFGNSFAIFVAPQNSPEQTNRDAADFFSFLVVYNRANQPLMIAQIKDDAWAKRPELRLAADEQIRRRFDALMAASPLRHMWALSLLGTSLRVYCGDNETGIIKPDYQARPDPNRVLPHNFLQGEWDLDILSQEGFNQMKAIITDMNNVEM